MSALKIVIRAGGTGTRLWPLSTTDVPKQFVSVLSDKSLLQETFARVATFGVENIFVTTNMRYVGLVRAQLPQLPADHIIAEPLKRNTGPGMAFETAVLASLFGEENPVIASIPSDDFVGNAEQFVIALEQIAAYLEREPEHIVLPLVTPAAVDPGYTYVRAALAETDAALAPIIEWVEKPDTELCGQMVASGGWFAHTGMYVWKLKTAVAMFQQLAPQVWNLVCRVRDGLAVGNTDAAMQQANELPIISIESLATKLYGAKVGYRADAWNWSDVGKWAVVKELMQHDEKSNASSHNETHFINARNNLVYGKPGKRVVCVGVADLIIVDRGDHLLVCRIDESHNIGSIAEQISKFGAVL